MNIYYMVKQLLKENKEMGREVKKMSEVCSELGVSLQSLNRSLHGGMSLDRFIEVMDKMGYEVMIGRREDGRAKDIRTIKQISREWEK